MMLRIESELSILAGFWIKNINKKLIVTLIQTETLGKL